jgi:predicted nucleic acid-binding protein
VDLDAMLWATADRIGVTYLLTENFQDRRVLGGVTLVDPVGGGNEPPWRTFYRCHEPQYRA